MQKASSGAIYLNPGPLPFHFGFVPNEKIWRLEMDRLGVSSPYPEAAGQCTWFETKGGRGMNVLVTFNQQGDGADPLEIVGIFAHEAMHVWQKALDWIGEEGRVSPEMEAYSYQAIFEQLLAAYVKTRNPGMFQKPKKPASKKASRNPRSTRYK